MAQEARAKVKLAGGREVWRDGHGRYRDVNTGRWVARLAVEAESISLEQDRKQTTLPPNRWQPEKQVLQARLSPGLSKEVEKEIIAAVRRLGLPASSLDEAVGQLLAVQAEIALDKENGAKSTSAARLISQAAGILGKAAPSKTEQQEGQPQFVLGARLAKQILAMAEAELTARQNSDQ